MAVAWHRTGDQEVMGLTSGCSISHTDQADDSHA